MSEPTWRPPQQFLHYHTLYRKMHQLVVEPPAHEHVPRVRRYLRALKLYFHSRDKLQLHRILWTQAWLDELRDPAEPVMSTD